MKKIPLSNNRGYALVDDADFPALSRHKWCIKKDKYTSYAQTHVYRDGKEVTVFMHREILGLKKRGKWKGDHRDGNGLNNQRSNLRACTHSQNCMNRHSTTGSSKYKGAHWYKDCRKWRAEIKKDGRKYRLGFYDSEDDAARAYDVKAKELFGEFASLNFPDENQQ